MTELEYIREFGRYINSCKPDLIDEYDSVVGSDESIYDNTKDLTVNEFLELNTIPSNFIKDILYGKNES
jgi:hypothetical protein